MSTKLRVFVSSTMKDLGDARRSVIKTLLSLNLEPVNAENLYPTGENSWDVIRNEIASCHILILLSGESYGWIPNEGFGADGKRSVTHLEVDYAKELGLPVLPFFQELGSKASKRSREAKLRDEFRREIEAWEGGCFRSMYDHADDLGLKVNNSLLDLFQSSTLKETTHRRDLKIATQDQNKQRSSFSGQIPPGFLNRSPTLFAGAGISIAAGLPNANVLTGLFGKRLGLKSAGDDILARHRFADVAIAVERRFGRTELIRIVVESFNTAQRAQPTAAHCAAVTTFRYIVTTNYDDLFEQACENLGVSYTVKSSNGSIRGSGSDLTIFKVDGSVGFPETLVITEADAARVRKNDPFWSHLSTTLQTTPVIMIGHSLRDDNARRIMLDRANQLGLYVSFDDDPLDDIIREKFGVLGITADADSFLTTFSERTKLLQLQQ